MTDEKRPSDSKGDVTESGVVQPYEPKMHLVVFGKNLSLDEIEADIRLRMGWAAEES